MASRYVVPLAHDGGRAAAALVATTIVSHRPRRCKRMLWWLPKAPPAATGLPEVGVPRGAKVGVSADVVAHTRYPWRALDDPPTLAMATRRLWLWPSAAALKGGGPLAVGGRRRSWWATQRCSRFPPLPFQERTSPGEPCSMRMSTLRRSGQGPRRPAGVAAAAASETAVRDARRRAFDRRHHRCAVGMVHVCSWGWGGSGGLGACRFRTPVRSRLSSLSCMRFCCARASWVAVPTPLPRGGARCDPAWLATVRLCVSTSRRPCPSVGGRRRRRCPAPAPGVCFLFPPRD